MKRPRPSTFAWQAVLILLPVAGLSALGWFATYRDYALTEQEARQRASDLASELARSLGATVALTLNDLADRAALWEPLIPPEDNLAPEPATTPSTPPAPEPHPPRLARTPAVPPDQHPEDFLPVAVLVTPSGNLEWPRPAGLPPPAPWVLELTDEQATLWQAAAHGSVAETDPEPAPSRIAAFLASGIPGPARANAEFIRLLESLPAIPPAERQGQLLEFAARHLTFPSESGLPLSTLALARALQEAAETGPDPRLFPALAQEIHHRPSFLTPRLLDDAARTVAPLDPEVRDAVAQVTARWHNQQRLRELARQTLAFPSPPATSTAGLPPTSPASDTTAHSPPVSPTLASTRPLWLDARSERWLALFSPPSRLSNHSGVAPEQPPTHDLLALRFFPKSLLRPAVDQTLAARHLTLPAYLGLHITLDGEPLGPTVSEPAPSAHPPPAPFATATAPLALGAWFEGEPRAGERPAAWPQPPELHVTLALTHPALLFAQARQRAWIFGSVVLAGLATALFGLGLTHRAFRHQLRLIELQSNFVSSVSHELRAPLASVRLLVESLDRGQVTDEPKRREYYRLLGQECRRLSSLIENVLDFSRLQQGRKHYEFEPTDLPALVAHTLRLFEPYAAEREVALRAQWQDPFPLQPSLDGQAWQQALINLLDNAVKHSPPGTTVEVTLEAPSDPPSPPAPSAAPADSPPRPADVPARSAVAHPSRPAVRLTVSDHGPGIPPADHHRIFEPFYRRGSELRRETPGIGIGLSIVKQIVEAHGGQVRVESEPGRGSRFILELPSEAALPRRLAGNHHDSRSRLPA